MSTCVTLGVQVTVGPDSDSEEIAEAKGQLRRQLLDLDVDAVDQPRIGEPPAGTEAVDAETVGASVVSLSDPQLLVGVLTAIRSWLAGWSKPDIKPSLGDDVLELTGVSSSEQRRLADEWLARHAG